jgi:L-ascorbate metabolism protein UlaG (beta-lactamase superfamily)
MHAIQPAFQFSDAILVIYRAHWNTVQLPVDFGEIGNRFDIDVALLPISGLVFFAGRSCLVRRICMSPSQAAEASLRLKAKVVIPIHYHITCFLPFFNTIINPGNPQQFLEQMRIKAPGVRAIVLDTGQTWKADF